MHFPPSDRSICRYKITLSGILSPITLFKTFRSPVTPENENTSLGIVQKLYIALFEIIIFSLIFFRYGLNINKEQFGKQISHIRGLILETCYGWELAG